MHKIFKVREGDEQGVGGKGRIFTSSIEGESTLDYAVYDAAHSVELLIRLEK
jgi:hypothetical protein